MDTGRPQGAAHPMLLPGHRPAACDTELEGRLPLKLHRSPGCFLQTLPATPDQESLQDPCQEGGAQNLLTLHCSLGLGYSPDMIPPSGWVLAGPANGGGEKRAEGGIRLGPRAPNYPSGEVRRDSLLLPTG